MTGRFRCVAGDTGGCQTNSAGEAFIGCRRLDDRRHTGFVRGNDEEVVCPAPGDAAPVA